MIESRRVGWSTLAIALTLVVAACGGSTEEAGETTVVVTAAPADDAVSSLSDVRSAVIRIEAMGSFDYPGEGTQYNEGFTGSGFFISPDGIAVTNNHVVTGAAFLQVYVEGESEPRNARILGVSECSDLAVIDVDGDGFDYLTWRTDESPVGTNVYAAGYPLGDAEYTLLDGIVSKENADGESSWASVDSVIEHTSDILPGSSGGPLVGDQGRVIGVNYAGDTDGQAFAIGYDELMEVLPILQSGEDVTSIGINGTAVSGDEGSGIWVHSVASGSAADLVGVRGGDIVSEISGLIPAVDGTMADYCDVLRSHNAEDALQIEVWRSDVDGYLEGTLNTDKVLAPNDGGTAAGTQAPGTTMASQGPYRLEVGECIDDDAVDVYASGGAISTVSCSTPHDNEMYLTYEFPAGPYPGEEAVAEQMTVACLGAFEGYVGRDYQTSALDIFRLFPEQEAWDAGERFGECLLYSVDGSKISESAYQSGW